MNKRPDLSQSILDCWQSTHRVSVHLIKAIDVNLWHQKLPGYSRKTVGMLAIHLHNTRCMWIKAIEKRNSVTIPVTLDNQASKKDVLLALKASDKSMNFLLRHCLENNGRLPTKPAWLNFPNDVIHLLSYFVAHEAHHRGQIIMVSRQLGKPFDRQTSGELWQWNKKHK